MRIYGYPPVVSDECRLLIVGSMPSIESLKAGFYYAHPRNAFWRILSDCFETPLPQSIDDKKRLLLDNRLALWDVYASCEREGSLDADIRAGEINDFASLFQSFPHLRAVLANGACAFNSFPKHMLGGREIKKMPSTSPAYTLPYAKKLALWREAVPEIIKEK